MKRAKAHDTEMNPLVVSPKIACHLLNCGLTRLYQLVAAGEIESFLAGRVRRITTRSIEDYVEREVEAQAGARRDTSAIAARSVAARRAKRTTAA